VKLYKKFMLENHLSNLQAMLENKPNYKTTKETTWAMKVTSFEAQKTKKCLPSPRHSLTLTLEAI
jgi:hypothetical protein